MRRQPASSHRIAPKGTPREIIDLLNKHVNEAMQDAAFKTRLNELGGISLAGSPEDFGKVVAAETEKWARVVKAANLKME